MRRSICVLCLAAMSAAIALAESPDSGLVLKTGDGRRWTGAPARVQIFAPTPGRPEMARISFSVSVGGGERLGVYAEVSTLELFHSSFKVELDGGRPTGPGLGVLSHAIGEEPRIARYGSLIVEMRGATVTGKIESDMEGLRSATFEGSLVVDCLVTEGSLKNAVNGSLSSGQALALDERFESGFCQAFQKLKRRWSGQLEPHLQ